MPDIENFFESLNNIYTKQVEEADTKGNADIWKKATDIFFDDINNTDDATFTFTDIEYLDGYFVFGTGTNSIIHFHVNECPGWRFGIWWNAPETHAEVGIKVGGEFFAQFEETIDKFKPSASTIKKEFVINEPKNLWDTWSIRKILEYIKNEPYLAFCRDYCCYEYNETYLSREEAEEIYNKYRTQTDKENELTTQYNTKILKWVEENILPRFNDARIDDNGEYWFPRYDVVAPLDKNSEAVNEAGVYSWFINDEMTDEDKKLLDDFNALINEAENALIEIDGWYHPPVHSNIYFYIQI